MVGSERAIVYLNWLVVSVQRSLHLSDEIAVLRVVPYVSIIESLPCPIQRDQGTTGHIRHTVVLRAPLTENANPCPRTS